MLLRGGVDRLDVLLQAADEGVGAALAAGVDRCHRRVQALGGAGGEQHVRAFGRQGLGDAEAEAAAGRQDEGALALETEIHGDSSGDGRA